MKMNFEQMLEEISDGFMNYNNLLASLENLLDSAYEGLDEETYLKFRQELKSIIMQEL